MIPFRFLSTDIFKERVGRDQKRYETIHRLINSKCSALRQTHKKKNDSDEI